MSTINRMFAIVTDPKAYLGAAYLLLSFPLGIFYFVFLVTGLSVGFSLIIILVGIPILIGVILASLALAAFERVLAMRMLRVKIPPLMPANMPANLWAKLWALLTHPATWKSIGYLFVKFPVGIFSFVLVVTLSSVSLGLMAAPFIYNLPGVHVGVYTGTTVVWQIDTMAEAVSAALAGALLGLGSLHAFKWTAWAFGRFARIMLGGVAHDGQPPDAANA